MTTALINVIVITTNRARTILRTLESLKRYDSNSVKVHLFDFASIDNTVAVIKDYLMIQNLNWSLIEITEPYKGCEDWNIALDFVDDGWISFLEGDDAWEFDLVSVIRNLEESYPKVGLVHFSGVNEKGLKTNGMHGNVFLTGEEYRSYMIKNLTMCYAPSQTFFRRSSDSKFLKFDTARYNYAPEPEFWLELCKFYDVKIFADICVYRGQSLRPNVKIDAVADLYTLSIYCFNETRGIKFILLYQFIKYIFFYHYLVYFKNVLKLQQKLKIEYLVLPINLTFKMFNLFFKWRK